MGTPLDRLTLKGFKSIESLEDFELHPLNVLIGANGAGKSNFVDFFRMLNALAGERLQSFVLERGGADGFFFLGPKHTPVIGVWLLSADNSYELMLKPTVDSGLMIELEGLGRAPVMKCLSSGSLESGTPGNPIASGRVVYHFHDTSLTAPMRREQNARDYEPFRHDASNLAAFLLRLRGDDPACYERIRDAVRLAAPFFDDFLLRPEQRGGEEKVRLEWRQTGGDYPFQPSQLSDGLLRYICLTVALSQPSPPATLIIDEPELGLHPVALGLLAEQIQAAAERTQVIISTQSPALLDCFAPEDIVTVNRDRGRSVFSRLDEAELAEWLEEYTVGDLWRKNVVRGGPTSE